MGKKVILTPKNRTINCASLKVLLTTLPVIKGHHVTRPAIIVNTAPILNT
jgi:hypothetical protein